tara:strand:+ start:41 stop:367 length:327 start_codon:yes stop_codon:yes gene_type:complete
MSKIEKMYQSLDTKPFYLRRALNPNTVTTGKNETVRLAQTDNIVYPTVRMVQPGKGGTGNTRLKKLPVKDALQLARNKRDFIRFSNEKDARYFAENFSKLIDKKRYNK